MKLKVLKNGFENNLRKPAKIGDVGYDLVAATMRIVGNSNEPPFHGINDFDKLWWKIDFIEYDTGVAIEPADYAMVFDKKIKAAMYKLRTDFNFCSQVRPRSSLSNYNLSLANHVATIDTGYVGTIKCRFKYLWQPEDLRISDGNIFGEINKEKIFQVGDRVAQIVFDNVIHPDEIIFSENLSESERGGGEFGSTGK